MACPDAETLGRWLAGEASAAERAAIADHAAECAACRALVDAWGPPTRSAVAPGETAAHDETIAAVATAPGAPAGELAVGAQVDRYRVLRRLGSGGMGVVYAAHDPELGRDVAIKLVRAGAPTERLAREAQALARLSHPNVVAVHDVGVHDGRTFIAMALVDGVDLRRWLVDEHPVGEILDVIRAAAAGVAAAHAAGLVHRDLKPDNIFVAADGRVLVGDFGLARELTSSEVDAQPTPSSGAGLAIATPLTGTGTVLGTPAYMAPEQAKGEATAASDQFSLCVTAWEALYGARPFRGASLRQLLDKIRDGTIARPARAGVPARVERALRRGLAADPDARFASVGELVRAIAPRRRRWPWIAGGLAAAAGVTAAIVLARGGADRGPRCDDTARAFDETWSPAARAALAKGLAPPSPSAGSSSSSGGSGSGSAVPVAAELDAYATRWKAARRLVCESAARGEERPDATGRRVACLDARRVAFARVLALPDDDPLTVWRAAEALPSIDACVSAAGAWATAVPTEQAAEVDAIEAAMVALNERHALTLVPLVDDATALRVRAEKTGFAPVIADSLWLEGGLVTDAADYGAAVALLRRAIRVSEDASYDLGRGRAALQLAIALADSGHLDEARAALDTADAALDRAGLRAEMMSDLGRARAVVADASGDPAGAAAILRRRVDDVRRRFGDDSVSLAQAWLDLAAEESAAQHETAAAAAIAAGYAIYARHAIGETSAPQAIAMDAMRALQAGELAHAIELSERATAAARDAHLPDATVAQFVLIQAEDYDVAGRVHSALTGYRDARALFERVPEVERDREGYAMAQFGVGASSVDAGDAAGAIEPLRTAAAIEGQLGARGADMVLLDQLTLGRALVAAGRMHEAREVLEPELRALRAATPVRMQRIGSAAFYLAQALWEDGDGHDRDRALALADEAATDLDQAIAETAGRPIMVTARRTLEARRRELTAWQARHRRP